MLEPSSRVQKSIINEKGNFKNLRLLDGAHSERQEDPKERMLKKDVGNDDGRGDEKRS